MVLIASEIQVDQKNVALFTSFFTVFQLPEGCFCEKLYDSPTLLAKEGWWKKRVVVGKKNGLKEDGT